MNDSSTKLNSFPFVKTVINCGLSRRQLTQWRPKTRDSEIELCLRMFRVNELLSVLNLSCLICCSTARNSRHSSSRQIIMLTSTSHHIYEQYRKASYIRTTRRLFPHIYCFVFFSELWARFLHSYFYALFNLNKWLDLINSEVPADKSKFEINCNS